MIMWLVAMRSTRAFVRCPITPAVLQTVRHATEVDRIRVKAIVEAEDPTSLIGQDVVIKGWARTVRAQKKLGFLEVNDGSSLTGLQCVFEGEELLATLKQVSTGCSVSVRGSVVASQGKQATEVLATSLTVVGECDGYPLQKKRHTLEMLRLNPSLRARTNTIAAVARVRSCLAQATHAFFHEQDFHYVHTPIITGIDCEGAGDMFRVTTLAEKDESKDFFRREAYLTVSGQLAAETYACGMGDVYTFGPTFRAENSQTTRHLAEFWMVEPEMAFADMHDAMNVAEKLLKYTVRKALDERARDLAFLDQFYGDRALLTRLESLSADEPFARISYKDAVDALRDEIAKDASRWQFPDVDFGTDLATEHERWLAETHFGGKCVFVYDYPRAIKAFYMRDNDDGTTAAFDLLAPGVGELIGGSQREERRDVLADKMRDWDLDPDEYQWYLDLRLFGTVPHAGFGLGFDRLVCYVTAQDNIRDVIPYPRYPGNLQM